MKQTVDKKLIAAAIEILEVLFPDGDVFDSTISQPIEIFSDPKFDCKICPNNIGDMRDVSMCNGCWSEAMALSIQNNGSTHEMAQHGDAPIKEINVVENNSKKHFKYTPITHKEAWDNRLTYKLSTSSNGEVFDIYAHYQNPLAILMLDTAQWYKMEECRVVGIEEAYLVIERGGKVCHEEFKEIDFYIEKGGRMVWLNHKKQAASNIILSKEVINGWVVLDEGKQG